MLDFAPAPDFDLLTNERFLPVEYVDPGMKVVAPIFPSRYRTAWKPFRGLGP